MVRTLKFENSSQNKPLTLTYIQPQGFSEYLDFLKVVHVYWFRIDYKANDIRYDKDVSCFK